MNAQRPTLDGEYDYPLHMVGAAHSVSSETDEQAEAIRRLHEVVEEITGKPVEQPQKQRIGFLP